MTGQLTATFANNPQLPFSVLHVKFDGGPQGGARHASGVWSKGTATTMTSWSGKSVALALAVEVACRPGLAGSRRR